MNIKIIIILYIYILIISCNKQNEIYLKYDKNIDPKDLKIELEIIYSTSKLIIYKDNMLKEIPNGYGENDWILSYKDSVYGVFRHFKTDKNAIHKYFFNFTKKGTIIICNAKIIGLNEYNNFIFLNSKYTDN